MNKRRAKKDACHVVAALIRNYMDVGQPHNDCYEGSHGWKPGDADKLAEAFKEIEAEMRRRAEL